MNLLLSYCSMGGYGVYVWSAYGLGFLSLILLTLSAKKHKKRIQLHLEQWFKG